MAARKKGKNATESVGEEGRTLIRRKPLEHLEKSIFLFLIQLVPFTVRKGCEQQINDLELQ
ncbi:hypothetical protein TIFTF001_016969 [Ficus carica]|uniref:Uncharacterized protein n=1 Tax=Ficus carica TaxID=3494 RepID=A0AA88D7U1_FICCA|nr:hypothetical protein TIFTF001_016969 [Ficus carica]